MKDSPPVIVTRSMCLEKQERHRCLAALVVTIAALNACANPGSQLRALEPIAAGTRVSISIDHKEIRFSGIETTDNPVATGAVTGGARGAAEGAVAGAALSLLCGSLFSTCAEVLVEPLATSGAASGATVGALEGAMIELPPDETAALNEALAGVDYPDIENSLRDEFLSQSEGLWIISDRNAAKTIRLGIGSIYLSQLDQDKLILNTRTEMQILSPSSRQGRSNKRVYSHTSGSYSAEEWFKNDGEILKSEIPIGIEKSVNQMWSALRPLHAIR